MKRQTVLALMISFFAVLVTAPVGVRGQTAARTVAWRLIDVASGQTVDGGSASVIDALSLPGSILNLPTLVAALESGAIKPDTHIACPGFAEIAGRRIACVHPRIRRPLSAAEALAYSCNHYFSEVGARLSRDRLNAVLASLGLPAAKQGTPLGLAAIGVDAPPVAPAALLRALVRIVAEPNALGLRPTTRSVVIEGLRGAALFGTAAGFGSRGVQALAKTGTAQASGGLQQGVVVAMWPADTPQRAAVVVVSGGSGPDAALVAADIAKTGRPSGTPTAPAATTAAPVAAPPPSVTASAQSAAPAVPDDNTQIRVGFSQAGGAYAARALPLEDYVSRVLAGEAAARSRPAALEALAITVRTFALANRNRHGKDGFDLCTTTHCQVLREPTAATRAAAAATAGLVLAWRGQPASVYYTASCGGRTERPSNVWPGAEDPPFMPSQPDAGCAGQPRWVTEIPAADLVRALRSAGFSGVELRDLRILSRNESGRVNQLEIKGLTPGQISGQALRMAVGRELGWQLLKSTSFDVTRSGPGYRFTGRGYGHGVGFCVIGATNRADSGASRADILAAYFPGLQVAAASRLKPVDQVTAARAAARPALDSGDAADEDADTPAAPTAPAAAESTPVKSSGRIVLRLPEGDERAREWIQSLAERALDAAASRSGRPVPTAIEVIFYSSQDAFTRATREPWWTAALTRGARIELQPVTALRQRSLLERTLAHEIAHIVTAPDLVGRPEWVKEGAAMFASGEITEAQIAAHARTRPTVGCPSDPEIRRAVSAAAARDAYERAGECFARALGQGRRWDDIR